MADPHHVEVLDSLDRLTVRTYRAGLTLSAVGLTLASWMLITGRDPTPSWWVIFAGTALSVGHIHLYDRTIRQIITTSGWIGAILTYVGTVLGWTVLAHAGLGFLFVALSAFALKERFCFRLALLPAVPVLLAGSLPPMLLGWPGLAGGLLAIAAFTYALLAIAKWRMPLHWDIGDKSRYSI